MRAVNLLPRDAERTRSRSGRRPLVAGLGGVAVVTAASVFLVFSASGAVDERRAELALTESAIAAIPRPDDSGPSSGLVVQERADRVTALAAALSSRIPVDRVLRELSLVLPEDAWLTGLIANAPRQAAPEGSPPGGGAQAPASTGAAGVTIQGVTYSHESVARVLARLSVLPSLEDVRLAASARITPETTQAGEQAQGSGRTKSKKAKKPRSVVTFTIEASLRAGGQR